LNIGIVMSVTILWCSLHLSCNTMLRRAMGPRKQWQHTQFLAAFENLGKERSFVAVGALFWSPLALFWSSRSAPKNKNRNGTDNCLGYTAYWCISMVHLCPKNWAVGQFICDLFAIIQLMDLWDKKSPSKHTNLCRECNCQVHGLVGVAERHGGMASAQRWGNKSREEED
jgi:hypothetical protein